MSSIGGFSSGAGVLSLLQSAGSSGGIFGALSGSSSASSATISALGVSNPAAGQGQSIQQILQGQGVQTQKNNIYKTIADRIGAIAAGHLQPNADWEKLAGYYAGTGVPFVVSLDSKGQPAITQQSQMDASRFSATQKNTLANALDTLTTLAPEVQANTNYTNLQNQWTSIGVNLVDIKNHNLVPSQPWQQQASTIMSINHPISYSLAPDGTVSVQDQTTSTFQDQPPAIRSVLLKASRIAADAVSSTVAYNQDIANGVQPPAALQSKLDQYSQFSWVNQASSYVSMGVPYTLGVDTKQIDTSVNYVSKTETTTYSNGNPTTTNSTTIGNNGTDGNGFPDTTTDATSPRPFATANNITTTIAGLTDGSGNAITPFQYTDPVTVQSTAANALTVTDTTTGNTDNFSYDGVGTVTVTTTDKHGTQIGSGSYNATGLSAVASQPPTTTLVDGSGKDILEPGSGQPITYANAVSVNRTDQYDMTVTNTANGNVDSYSAQLDGGGNPIQNAQGNYLLTVTHTDSLGRTIGASQTLASANPGINALSASNTSPLTIAADGAGTTNTINNQTILPITQYSSATGGNGNVLANVITDGSGNALATYTSPVSIAQDTAGNITVTDKKSGNIDTYTDNGNGTISIAHTDSAGDVIKTASTANGSGLNALTAQTPTLSFIDGSGNAITADNGAAIPTYTNPVSVTNTSSGADTSYTVTDSVSGYVDTYAYNSGTGTLNIVRNDAKGDQLSTQTASGLNGFSIQSSAVSVGVTDSSGNALTDTSGAAAPTYTNPVSFKDAGGGNFSITDSITGNVDTYAYDSQAQTLSISHADGSGNLLSTQDFTGVAGVTKPWVSMADSASSGWTVTPPPATVTDASGNTLTDSNGKAAPTYSDPVTISDSGAGNFSVTNNTTGYVDTYAYDSAAQTLNITEADNAGNTLATQSFSAVNGLTVPWASQQAANPNTWNLTPTGTSVTDAAGATLTDSNGQAAPTYTSPITIADSGSGNFSVTNNATGYVDTYAYNSAAQTLNITEADNAGNTLTTQSFSGVTGITVPWAAQQAANPATLSVPLPGTSVTDASGNTLTDSNGKAAPTYASPVTISDSGGGNFTITTNATGTVDTYAYNSAAQTLSITEKDNGGNTIAIQNFSGVTGLTQPWASQQAASPTTWSAAPTTGTGVTDASGNTLTDGNGKAAPTYDAPVTVSDSGSGNFSVTNNVTGYVDTYAYDSAARTLNIVENDNGGNILAIQNFSGVTGLTVPWAAQQAANPTNWNVAAGATVTDASGNALTDTNSNAAPTYANAVAVSDSGNGNFSVTDTVTGYVDTYAYNSAAQTLNITEADNSGNTLATQSFTGVNGLTVPWAAQQAASPTTWSAAPPGIGVTDATGNALTDSNGQAAPTYDAPITIKDSGSGNFAVTNSLTGYVDTYAYNSAAQTLNITEADNAGNTLATQSFSGVNGLTVPWASQQAASPTTWSVSPGSLNVTDASGTTLTDSNGQAAPTYSDPVTVKDSGSGNFSVTNNSTGYVDTYAYNSAAQTLNITQADNAGNTLATQSFSGVTGITVPWAAQQAANPSSLSESPTTAGVTDASGNALTDSNGQAAPTYTAPVTVKDSGSGNFSVTNTTTGYVDTYAYDSAAQTLNITEADNAGNTLATQSFSGVNGLTVPWASQQAASPASWNVTATPVGITDGSGNTLTDGNGQAAPTYTDPISVKDSGGGKFAVTDNTTGYVDKYAYDSVAQTLDITHLDNSGNTLSTQNFTGVSGISGLNIPAASLQPAAATNWDVFNQTTLNSSLTSLTGYSTSYDTSTFNQTDPANHTVTANAYTSTTSFSYTNVNVGNPSMMQALLPNLQLNYVSTPKITVTPVTDIPMPKTVEPATQPYNIDTTRMPKWESDALGFMKGGTPFMLNFDQQGNLTAQQLTGDNIIKFNNPTTPTVGYNPNAQTSSGLSGVALMLSTLA